MLAALLVALEELIGSWFGWSALRTLLVNVWGYIARSKIKQIVYLFIANLFAAAVKEVVEEGLDSEYIKQAIITEIFKHTGLELETLDAEGAKQAAGKLLAQKFNAQYGTSFETFYPPENLLQAIKDQIVIEIQEALE